MIKARKMVQKNFNELGTGSLICVPEVSLDRSIKRIVHIYPPKSPLERFFTDRDNRKFIRGLNKALEDTQLWALELWEAKDNDDTVKIKEMLDLSSDDEEESEEEENQIKIEKPSKPIFSMTSDEISCYFGILLKEIYKLEGVQKYKLWSKVQNGVVIKKATELKAYDKKAEEILPRDVYYGRGSGGANIGNKLKVVTAYLLDKQNIDHNMFADNIPPNYKPVHINFDNYGDMLEDTEKAKRTKPKAIRTNVQLVHKICACFDLSG